MTDTPSGSVARDGAGTAPVPALDARTRWSIRLGLLVLRALAATWRMRVEGAPFPRGAFGSVPVVLTLWHGEMLPCLYAHRVHEATVLISAHRDGEIIANIVRAFGMSTVRGSTSRGGARALLALVATLRRGDDIAITPDGPRGPRWHFAPGAVAAARRAGAATVAMRASATRAWRLRTWDGFVIPKPFARVAVVYDAPQLYDGRVGDAEDVARAAAAMRRIGVRARQLAGLSAEATRRAEEEEARIAVAVASPPVGTPASGTPVGD